jgi:hypothetical protein
LRNDDAREQEANQASNQSTPITPCDKIETGDSAHHSEQEATAEQ